MSATFNYQRYLRSNKWQGKRRSAQLRAGFSCQRCGKSKSEVELHVHHLTYVRIGREEERDLVVLCKGCHTHVHSSREAGRLLDVKFGVSPKDSIWGIPGTEGRNVYAAFDCAMTERHGPSWSIRLSNSDINFEFDAFEKVRTNNE